MHGNLTVSGKNVKLTSRRGMGRERAKSGELTEQTRNSCTGGGGWWCSVSRHSKGTRVAFGDEIYERRPADAKKFTFACFPLSLARLEARRRKWLRIDDAASTIKHSRDRLDSQSRINVQFQLARLEESLKATAAKPCSSRRISSRSSDAEAICLMSETRG
jgi:hypothetical protein